MAWAKYLRKVHCEWVPFNAKATAPLWLDRVSCKKVKDAIPKLEYSKNLQPGLGEAAIDKTDLTFADGTTITLDLSTRLLGDVIEEIDMINGRIAAEEAKRGKPFS